MGKLSKEEKAAKIKQMFYDPKKGLWSVDKIHDKLKAQGVNVDLSEVRDVLENQLVNQVFKPVGKYKKEFTSIVAKHAREQYQCDLIDLQKYAKFNTARYMLNCIDVYSRYAMAVPIKTKGDAHVIPAMEQVFATMGYCKNFNSDLEASLLGKKFQAILKRNHIKHWQHDPIDNKRNMSIIERINKTIRGVIQKYFYVRGTKNWVKVLPDLIENYNTTEHSTTQQAPKDMFNDKQAPVYRSRQKTNFPTHTIKVGDKVRVLKRYGTFTKKTDVKNWTKNVYTVQKIEGQTFYVKSDKGVVQQRKEFELQAVDAEKVTTEDDVEQGDEGKEFKKEVKKQQAARRLRKEDIESDLVNTAPAREKRERKPVNRFK